MPGAGHRRWELSQQERIKWVVDSLNQLNYEIEKIEQPKRSTQEIANELLTCDNFKRANVLIDELL